MDAASQTWPPPTPSPPPFSSRPRAASPSPSPRRRHSKKHKPPPAPARSADFSALPPELLHQALAAACASDVAAASRACRAWRDALQPLREAAALHAYGRCIKHGASRGGGGGGSLDTERQRALWLFRRAARLGSAAAMVDAGLMCWEDGRREEAVAYYRSAAELGHPIGMCNLGVSYLEGNARAQYNLGLCLQNGKGLKRNQKEAAKWYLRAAEGGNVRAMYNISLCYNFGEGLSQDPLRAKRWLQLAADCGHKKALYECGIKLCAAGDKVKSLTYLELATRRGETAAAHMRDVILESLSAANAQRALSDADKWKPRAVHPQKVRRWTALKC
ncbi:hypothetical protein BS78_06G133100 [Paspalum vaginatum]|nr:hypothetical protein BS78_06G133100 [Paspalum vaginatum]